MKIAYLTDGMGIGGAETHVMTLLFALRDAGEDPFLISDGGVLAERIENAGFRTYRLPLRKRTVGAFLCCRRELRKILSREAPDVLHAHTRYTAFLCRNTGFPLCVTYHLDFPLRFFQRPFAVLGDATLAVGEDIREGTARKFRTEKENIAICVNGIDRNVFGASPPNFNRIVCISRFDRDRSEAAKALCRIFPRLKRKFPDLRLILAGDGDDRKVLLEEISRAERAVSAGSIRYLGAVAHPEEILREGGVFVGVSRAALEAASAGLPVVLAGNEGFGGWLTSENFSHAAQTNFCAREDEPLTDAHLEEILSLLLSRTDAATEEAKKIRGILARDYSPAVMARAARDACLRAVRKRNTAFVLGYFGFGNFGDELTRTAIESLSDGFSVSPRFFGKGREVAGEKVKPMRLPAMRRALFSSRVFVLGGGTLFQDGTSRRSFLFYCAFLHAALRRGIPTVFLCGGIGKLRRKWEKRLLGRLLSRCDRLYFRTAGDLLYAKNELGVAAEESAVIGDLCFSLPEIPRTVGSRIVYLPKAGGEWQLPEPPDRVLCLFPEEDGQRKNAPRTLGEFAQSTAGAGLIVTERLHGAIAALLTGCPTAVDCRSEKTAYFCDGIGRLCRDLGILCPVFPYRAQAELAGLIQRIKKGTCPDFGASSHYVCESMKSRFTVFRDPRIFSSSWRVSPKHRQRT